MMMDHGGSRSTRPLLVAVAALTTLLAACVRPVATPSAPSANWVGSWNAAQQLVEPRNLPPAPGLSGSTLRQVVHLSIGGSRVRFHFSNVFGDGPVALDAVHVAVSAGGSAIRPETDRAVTFEGRPSVAIAAGASAVSDPLDVALAPFADLAVTIAFGQAPAAVTGHPGSRATTYLQAGDRSTAPDLPDAVKTEHWYILSGADVIAADGSAAVIALGNSITDGRGSGTDKNDRWTDDLARRLEADPRTAHVAVLNAGLGGNTVIRGGLGPTALSRLDRDVAAPAGARWLVVLEGVNDIGTARGSEAVAAIAGELIAGYQRIIAMAHEHGLRVYGATILPFGGSNYDAPDREAARQAVNRWIRTSGAYDAVIDFDAVMRDSLDPARLRAEADVGDHLHPSEAGYRLMADAIDLSLFAR
jgi:lysophospholipase L1-like esterase